MKKPRKINDIDVGLDILCILVSDGQTLSAPDIADVCGCSTQRIYEIQQSALKKADELQTV